MIRGLIFLLAARIPTGGRRWELGLAALEMAWYYTGYNHRVLTYSGT
jgi:hypothetical protein